MPAPKGNKFALGLTNSGRPPMFKTPKELEKKINEYFESLCDDDGVMIESPTVTGMTLFLGFCDKKSLRDYKEKEEFAPLIKRALTSVEFGYEQMLLSKASTGAIFALKNMGWLDSKQTELTGKGGGPIQTESLDAEKLDDKERSKLLSLLDKMDNE